MSKTQEPGQHMVLLVAAGDGSDAACEAVAQKLSEKFGTPFDKMLASVRQTPRVFKRNLNHDQAESYAAMLRSMGAVVEVKTNGTSTEPKPPPPEVMDHTCPFCGRTLHAGGVCVICKPREVAPLAAEPPSGPEPEPATEEPATDPQPVVEPDPSLTAGTGVTQQSQPPPDPGIDPGLDDQDDAPPEPEQVIPADSEWAAPAPAEECGLPEPQVGQGPPVEAACANCGNQLVQQGQCPTCDPGTAGPMDESAAIENNLSALLSPEDLGVCPNCCGPMEQDGTCLICPPADPSKPQPAVPTASPASAPAAEVVDPAAAVPEAPGDVSPGEPQDAGPPTQDGEMTDNAAAMPGRAAGHESSPFEPLAPLNAEPEVDGANICPECGGPKGTDGTCLICGDDAAGAVPAFDEMPVTGNEPPPAQTVETAAPAMVAEAIPAAAAAEPQNGKKPSVNLDRSRFPRALAIPLLATLLLLIGGTTLAMAGSFIMASGVLFLALIAGLVTVFNGIQHLERTVNSFPKLPKPVIFAFLLFLFFAGSSGIAGYAFKQSALFLLDKASEEIQAEINRLPDGTGAEQSGDQESLENNGQILMEEEMFDRAITAEGEGEENPRAALENWTAYLEGFPDGTKAPEARRKISHWQAVVKREDALATVIARDHKGNNDPVARIRDWRSCIATYGNTPAIRAHAEERIGFWESMLGQNTKPTLPYWASLRLDDGREFSGKVVGENENELKMELPNRLKMSFNKNEYEIIDSDHINGKRVEGESMQLVSGVTAERPHWGREDGITILGENRAGVEAMVSFRSTGFYHFEVLARATKDHSGFPSVILSLNGTQQERIRFDSEEWKLYRVSFPFRIPAGQRRLEIVFPPQYQTMKDKRIVAIDYFTTAMVE